MDPGGVVMIARRQAALAEWKELWRIWWETLDQVERGEGEYWDRYTLAAFLDIPALGLRDLIPEIADMEIGRDFDLLGEVRRSARLGIERIEARFGERIDRRLPLASCATEMILLWEWKRGLARGEKTMAYVNRIRQLRDEFSEFELEDRAVADFIFRLASREN
jgi:hypothetical protein